MPISFVIDEDVPQRIGAYLSERGHQVVRADALVGHEGAPDHVVAALADDIGAIVLTWNKKDYKKIIKRGQQKGGSKLLSAGLISFHRVKETVGLTRLKQVIDTIEFEYGWQQNQKDSRLIATIAMQWFKFER